MTVKTLAPPIRVLVIAVFVLAGAAASYAQGNVEATGHLGIVSGIGSHGSFGGSLGIPVADKFILLGDASYIPMGGANVTTPNSSTSASSKAFNFNGTLQYQFKQTRTVTPYAGAGLGFLHSSFDTSGTVAG